MNYHLARNNEHLGTHPAEAIRNGLSNGSYLSTDLAWTDGMAEWKPLGSLVEFAAANLPPGAAATTVVPPILEAGALQEGGSHAAFSGQPVQHVVVGVMPTPGTAIASLVLGIVSLVTCYFGLLFAIPGAICGHMALKSIRLSGNRLQGRGLAVAGLVMSYLWLGLFFAVVLFMVVAGTIAALTGGG